MENYICVETVEAEPQTNHDFATWANGGVLPEEYATKTVLAGYKVVEGGGKAYWLSDAQFDAKFTKTGEMTFGDAISVMMTGGKVTRAGWSNPDIYCQIKSDDTVMTEDYIYMTKNAGATVFPATLSCESVLANDWQVIE